MVVYNAITDTILLSVLRYGSATFVAGAGETLITNVGKRPEGIALKYIKVSGGVLVEMTAEEKTVVDNAEPTTDISSARTLDKSETGGKYTVSQIGSNYTITLPTTAEHLKYEFHLVAETAFSVTIKASGAHLFGRLFLVGTQSDVTASTNIIFAATNANINDRIEMHSVNPTYWCVTGYSTHASGITVS